MELAQDRELMNAMSPQVREIYKVLIQDTDLMCRPSWFSIRTDYPSKHSDKDGNFVHLVTTHNDCTSACSVEDQLVAGEDWDENLGVEFPHGVPICLVASR